MVLGRIVDEVSRGVEGAADGISQALFEPVIRLGVTGLSRAGKTVFITSLIANLLERGRMGAISAISEGRIEAAFLQPQPNDTIPRFAYEGHLAAMTGPTPRWPEGTNGISQLRLSLRVAPSGILSSLRSPKIIHLDIVDYPGEWLLDLPLMQMSFAQWSQAALVWARDPARSTLSAKWFNAIEGLAPDTALDEPQAEALAKAYRAFLTQARAAGFSGQTPGRFLMPGDLEGSPALTFCPLNQMSNNRGSLYREFSRRFEAYKSQVVLPFFRDHFSRIDRQIVLVDALGAIHAGPQAVADLQSAMVDVLACFRAGQNGFLSAIIGKRVEKILFAATKADHLHHAQHPALEGIMTALLQRALTRAEIKGVETKALAIAALRATTEQQITHDGAALDCVQGTLQKTGKEAAMFAGDLPSDPMSLVTAATSGASDWLDAEYSVMKFAPAKNTLKRGEGPPHIRLDQAAEFLIGDRL